MVVVPKTWSIVTGNASSAGVSVVSSVVCVLGALEVSLVSGASVEQPARVSAAAVTRAATIRVRDKSVS
jgi:hypothetical protein